MPHIQKYGIGDVHPDILAVTCDSFLHKCHSIFKFIMVRKLVCSEGGETRTWITANDGLMVRDRGQRMYMKYVSGGEESAGKVEIDNSALTERKKGRRDS